MYMEVEPAKVRALLKSNPALFPLAAYDSLKGATEEDYDAKETTTSLYGSTESSTMHVWDDPAWKKKRRTRSDKRA